MRGQGHVGHVYTRDTRACRTCCVHALGVHSREIGPSVARAGANFMKINLRRLISVSRRRLGIPPDVAKVYPFECNMIGLIPDLYTLDALHRSSSGLLWDLGAASGTR